MKFLSTIALLLILSASVPAQNLVPNPGFEDFINCPNGPGEIYCPLNTFPPPTVTAKSWVSAVRNSPHYYNACSGNIYSSVPNNYYGYHPAHNGNAYAGFQVFGGYHEHTLHDEFYTQYVVTPLTTPLIAGETYNISCYIKLVFSIDQLHIINIVGVKAIDVVFTDTLLTALTYPIKLPATNTPLHATTKYITDTTQWVKITGTYVAQGTEKFMTLGMFDNGSIPEHILVYPPTLLPFTIQQSYYLLDDVSVTKKIPCDTFKHSTDSLICKSNFSPHKLNSSATPGNNTYAWSTGSTAPAVTTNTSGTYWCVAVEDDCRTTIDTFHITIFKKKVNTATTKLMCYINNHKLEAGKKGADSYLWNSGAPTPELTIHEPGTYWCAYISNCILYTDTFHVINKGVMETVTLGKDTAICNIDEISLGKEYKNATTYQWNTGETICCITPKETGTYTISVSDYCGVQTDTIDVTINNCNDCLFIPDAFSPNKDGLNDIFRVIARCQVQYFFMAIYNRWGQQIFSTQNINTGWNGMQASDNADVGTYFYRVEYKTEYSNEMKTLKGDVLLLR